MCVCVCMWAIECGSVKSDHGLKSSFISCCLLATSAAILCLSSPLIAIKIAWCQWCCGGWSCCWRENHLSSSWAHLWLSPPPQDRLPLFLFGYLSLWLYLLLHYRLCFPLASRLLKCKAIPLGETSLFSFNSLIHQILVWLKTCLE